MISAPIVTSVVVNTIGLSRTEDPATAAAELAACGIPSWKNSVAVPVETLRMVSAVNICV